MREDTDGNEYTLLMADSQLRVRPAHPRDHTPPWRSARRSTATGSRAPRTLSSSSSSSSSSADSMDSVRPRRFRDEPPSQTLQPSPRRQRRARRRDIHDAQVWNRLCSDLALLAGCPHPDDSDSDGGSENDTRDSSYALLGHNTATRNISLNTSYVYNIALAHNLTQAPAPGSDDVPLPDPADFQHIDRPTCNRWYPGAAGGWLWTHLRQRNLDAFHSTARNAATTSGANATNAIWSGAAPTATTRTHHPHPPSREDNETSSNIAPWAHPWTLIDPRPLQRPSATPDPNSISQRMLSDHPSNSPASAAEQDSRHPPSAFQVPPASSSLSNRLTAAEEVARMADQARRFRSLRAETLARNATASAAGNAQNPASTTRRTESPGMTFLRTLRDLDGIGGPNGGSQADLPGQSGSASSAMQPSPSGTTPTQPWQLFPWYPPNALGHESPDSSLAFSSTTYVEASPPSSASATNPDPDGDGIRTNWFRGVRGRMIGALAEELDRQAMQDPDGEMIATDDTDRAFALPDPATATPRPLAHQPSSSDARIRQRNRSAVVLSSPPGVSEEDVRDDDDAERSRWAAQSWTLVTSPNATESSSIARGTTQPRPAGQDSFVFERSGPGGTTVDQSPSPGVEPRGPLSDHLASPSAATSMAPSTLSQSRFRSSPVPMNSSEGSDNNEQRRLTPSHPSAAVSDPRVARRPQRLPSIHYDGELRVERSPQTATSSLTRDQIRHITDFFQHQDSTRGTRQQGPSSTSEARDSELPASQTEFWRRQVRIQRDTRIRMVQMEDLRRFGDAMNEHRSLVEAANEGRRQTEAETERLRSTEAQPQHQGQTSDRLAAESSTATVVGASTSAQAQMPSTTSVNPTSLVRRRTLRDSAPQLRPPRFSSRSNEEPSMTMASSSGRPQVRENPVDRDSRVIHEPDSSVKARSSNELVARPLCNNSDEGAQPGSSPPAVVSSSGRGAARRIDYGSTLNNRRLPLAAVASRTHADDLILLHKQPHRQVSLLTRQDQARLGFMGAAIISAVDARGLTDRYDRINRELRELQTRSWAPTQPILSDYTYDTVHPLRFEVPPSLSTRWGPNARSARNALRNDQTCMSFDASKGTCLEMRFLAAMPASGLPTNPDATTAERATRARQAPYPTDRRTEDRVWDQARRNVLSSGSSGRGANGVAINDLNSRRAALGMAPREEHPSPGTVQPSSETSRPMPTPPPASRSTGSSPLPATALTSDTWDAWMTHVAANADAGQMTLSRFVRVLQQILSHRYDSRAETIGEAYFRDRQETSRNLEAVRLRNRQRDRPVPEAAAGQRSDDLQQQGVQPTAATSSSGSGSAGGDNDERDDGSESGQDSDASDATVRQAVPAARLLNRFSLQANGATLSSAETCASRIGHVAVTRDEFALIEKIIRQVQAADKTFLLRHGHLVDPLSLVDESLGERLIEARAASVRRHQWRKEGARNPDLCGPSFTMHSVNVKLKAGPSNGSGFVRALIFAHDERIPLSQFSDWEGVNEEELNRIIDANGLTGPGLSRREGQSTENEQRPMMPPRRPKHLPRGCIKIALRETASEYNETITFTENQESPAESQAANSLGVGGPCGRYVYLKFLPCEAGQQEQAVDLQYVGVKGWPFSAVGMDASVQSWR